MSKPFDSTLNALIDARPGDWVAYLAPKVGLAAGPAEVLDTDLSVTAQADKAFRLLGPTPAVLHLELEANPRRGIPADLHRYNTLLGHGRDEPVHTVIVLLRPKANATDLTGEYVRLGADGRPYLLFRYAVVRLWEETVGGLLGGGPATVPLALLTDEAAADLPGAAERFADRLRQPDVDVTLAKVLTGAAYMLAGMRYDAAKMEAMMERFAELLEESTTYQATLRKGELRGELRGELKAAREIVLELGEERFGPPPEGVRGAIQAVGDPSRLGRMAKQISKVDGWDDLLATP